MARKSPVDTKILAIASQKGGCSKTTLAVHLAVYASQSGRSCVLVDLDPQESASRWYDRREAQEPLLVTSTAGNLGTVIEAAKDEGREWVVVDTPPHAAGQIELAVQLADLVIVPVKATPMDLDALPGTIEILRRHTTPAGILLSATPPRPRVLEEARELLATDYPDFPVLPTEIGHRVAFVDALTDGLAVSEFDPDSKAAAEIAAVYSWCSTRLYARRSS